MLSVTKNMIQNILSRCSVLEYLTNGQSIPIQSVLTLDSDYEQSLQDITLLIKDAHDLCNQYIFNITMYKKGALQLTNFNSKLSAQYYSVLKQINAFDKCIIIGSNVSRIRAMFKTDSVLSEFVNYSMRIENSIIVIIMKFCSDSISIKTATSPECQRISRLYHHTQLSKKYFMPSRGLPDKSNILDDDSILSIKYSDQIYELQMFCYTFNKYSHKIKEESIILHKYLSEISEDFEKTSSFLQDEKNIFGSFLTLWNYTVNNIEILVDIDKINYDDIINKSRHWILFASRLKVFIKCITTEIVIDQDYIKDPIISSITEILQDLELIINHNTQKKSALAFFLNNDISKYIKNSLLLYVVKDAMKYIDTVNPQYIFYKNQLSNSLQFLQNLSVLTDPNINVEKINYLLNFRPYLINQSEETQYIKTLSATLTEVRCPLDKAYIEEVQQRLLRIKTRRNLNKSLYELLVTSICKKVDNVFEMEIPIRDLVDEINQLNTLIETFETFVQEQRHERIRLYQKITTKIKSLDIKSVININNPNVGNILDLFENYYDFRRLYREFRGNKYPISADKLSKQSKIDEDLTSTQKLSLRIDIAIYKSDTILKINNPDIEYILSVLTRYNKECNRAKPPVPSKDEMIMRAKSAQPLCSQDISLLTAEHCSRNHHIFPSIVQCVSVSDTCSRKTVFLKRTIIHTNHNRKTDTIDTCAHDDSLKLPPIPKDRNLTTMGNKKVLSPIMQGTSLELPSISQKRNLITMDNNKVLSKKETTPKVSLIVHGTALKLSPISKDQNLTTMGDKTVSSQEETITETSDIDTDDNTYTYVTSSTIDDEISLTDALENTI